MTRRGEQRAGARAWFPPTQGHKGRGNRWSASCLGSGLANGDYGFEIDLEEGIGWLRRAIEMGEEGAMADLGEALLRRNRSDRDRQEARKWLRAFQTATPGKKADFVLGKAIHEGVLDAEAGEDAVALLVGAAEDGFVPAVEYLKAELPEARPASVRQSRKPPWTLERVLGGNARLVLMCWVLSTAAAWIAFGPLAALGVFVAFRLLAAKPLDRFAERVRRRFLE